MKAEAVKQAMNRAAAKGQKFLFGVDYELEEGFFVEDPMQHPDILFRCGHITNAPESFGTPRNDARLEVLHSDRQGYRAKFAVIRNGELRGDSFLANLTERTPIATNCSLEEIFHRSHSRYGLLLSGRLVCFSPESFVRIIDGKIHSYPMKGTIDASLPDAAQRLMDDEKERAEHFTIVDLIRNDLNMVAQRVRVERFRYIERLATLRGEILQTSSDIVGSLTEGWQEHLGDVLFRLLPAGSISGAPKAATLDLIRHAEQYPRGYYTGVFGYFDGHDLDSAVMIRFIEQDPEGRLWFRSGGGVTIHSDADAEYDEIITKIYLPFQ